MVPSLSFTAPTLFEFESLGRAESTEAERWNLTPFSEMIRWMILPTSAPMTRSRGTDSMPTTETLLSAARQFATSMPMKDDPTTTMFFPFFSPTAETMA